MSPITIINILRWFIGPIGRYVGIGLIVSAIFGSIYTKGRLDDHKAFKEKIERESAKAVAKADTARKSATAKFDAGGLRNDGFRRD